MNFNSVTTLPLLKTCSFSLLLFASTGNAAPLIQELSTDTNKLNLTHNGIIIADSVIIDFKKMQPINIFTYIKNNYLTIYTNKTEKIRASYKHGMYAINYTQKW